MILFVAVVYEVPSSSYIFRTDGLSVLPLFLTMLLLMVTITLLLFQMTFQGVIPLTGCHP